MFRHAQGHWQFLRRCDKKCFGRQSVAQRRVSAFDDSIYMEHYPSLQALLPGSEAATSAASRRFGSTQRLRIVRGSQIPSPSIGSKSSVVALFQRTIAFLKDGCLWSEAQSGLLVLHTRLAVLDRLERKIGENRFGKWYRKM
jgi:hypothetical protein